MGAKKAKISNNVRTLREEILLSKAELARKAGVSPLTVDRIENGAECRMDTKRKIILALGKKLQEKEQVFPDLARGTGDKPQNVEEQAEAPSTKKKAQ